MSPSFIRPGVAKLFRLALRKQTDLANDADDEIEFHLTEREQRLVASGMSAADARTEARRRFGDIESARKSFTASSERVEQRKALRESVSDLMHDIRFAFRSLKRAPAFVVVTVACLTLGIGANVAIFAVVDAVLLKPLQFRSPEQLVSVWSKSAVPPGIFEIVKRESKSFSMLEGAEGGRQLSLTGIGEPTRVMVSKTTAGLFAALGVEPLLGNAFAANDNEASTPNSVLVSHALWETRFGSDSAVLGKTIQLNGISHTIVGVMPPKLAFPSAGIQLWIPAKFVRNSSSYWWSTYLTLVGRLKPSVTARQASAEAALVFPRARSAFPMRIPDTWGLDVDVTPLQESIVESVRPTMVLLYAAVALVLLVACVNVASLYIGRTLVRAREMAVRTALGAGSARIARLILVESVLVAVVGAAFGLAFAWVALRALVIILPADTPRVAEVALGTRAVGMAALLSVGSAIVFALLPTLGIARRGLSVALRSDGRSGTSRAAGRTSFALAVAQISLAVTLVASAGLLVRSLWKLQNSALGFTTTNVLTAEVPWPSFPNDTATRAPQFYDAVLEQVRGIRDVTAAAVTTSLPFGDGIQNAAMEVEAHPTPAGGVPPLPQLTAVSAEYFRVLNVPLINGRPFTEADREGALRVGLIDEVAARTFWPEGNVIGQRIRYVWSRDWITIIGVVGNVKRDSLSGPLAPSLYLPARQDFPRTMRLIMQTTLSPEALSGVIRTAVARVDATVPMGELRLLKGIVNGSAARERFVALLLAAFGVVALLLGAVGIYGVVSASVAQRTREIGVRMALGATKANVLRAVLGQSLAISTTGLVLGIAGAMASASRLRSVLAGVSVLDLTVLSGVVALLAVVSVGAALAPALRASRVDPLTAIRAE